MPRTSLARGPKLPQFLYSRRFIHSTSSLCEEQQLYQPFVRPLNREQKHNQIKEVLKTKCLPHSKIRFEIETLLKHNELYPSEKKKRRNVGRKVLESLQKDFPKDNIDIMDISMDEYGVKLRQAPLELAIVDLDNPRGLPAGTVKPSSQIYSLYAVCRSIRKHWTEAKLSFERKENGMRPIHEPVIITNDFILSLPSPLHKPRIDLLKAYTNDYGKFQRLLWFNFMLIYCQNSLRGNALALSYHMLGFFMDLFKVPSYLAGIPPPIVNKLGPSISPKPSYKASKKGDIKGGKKKNPKGERNHEDSQVVVLEENFPNDTTVRVHGQWDRRFVQEALVDTRITPQPIVDTTFKQDWVDLGYEELRIFLRYFRWTLEFDMSAFAVTPGRGISSRYIKPNWYLNTSRSPQESDLIRQGLMAPEKTPAELQTWDWATAVLVVQDPFWPTINLATNLKQPILRRLHHLCRGFEGSIYAGNSFIDTLQPIIHPSIEPPSFPNVVLTSSLHYRDGPAVPRPWGPSGDVPSTKSLMSVPGPESEDTPKEESRPSPIKTPYNLEGDLFR